MRALLKKIIPKTILGLYRKIRYSDGQVDFIGETVEETFTNVYKTNSWGSNESISGPGSERLQTEIIIKEIGILLDNMN